MKTELNRYEVNQLYLLNDGRFALIIDVDPVTKFSATENDRNLRVRYGRTRSKKDGLGGPYDMFIENEPTNTNVVITTRAERMSIAAFRRIEAKYFGKLTDDAAKRFAKINADYVNSL